MTRAFAATSSTSPLAQTNITRREVGPTDVEFDILYCGVCHSDLHAARSEWSAWPTVYPCVPGHEIVGRVTKVGPKVTRFKLGDLADNYRLDRTILRPERLQPDLARIHRYVLSYKFLTDQISEQEYRSLMSQCG